MRHFATPTKHANNDKIHLTDLSPSSHRLLGQHVPRRRHTSQQTLRTHSVHAPAHDLPSARMRDDANKRCSKPLRDWYMSGI